MTAAQLAAYRENAQFSTGPVRRKNGRNSDPSNDFPPESQPLGFVFSRSKILRQIERDRRLSRALELHAEFENLQ